MFTFDLSSIRIAAPFGLLFLAPENSIVSHQAPQSPSLSDPWDGAVFMWVWLLMLLRNNTKTEVSAQDGQEALGKSFNFCGPPFSHQLIFVSANYNKNVHKCIFLIMSSI